MAAAEVSLAEARLARLLNGSHLQQRREAAALCRAKQADLDRAQLAWKRIEQLARDQAVSQQEADNQRLMVAALAGEVDAARARLGYLEATARPDEVRIEQAQIAAAKARLQLAQVQQEHMLLRTPCCGQILSVSVHAGEMAGPTSVEPAIILADTSKLCVRAFIDEMDAPRVSCGAAVRVIAEGLPDQQFRGRVSRLSPRMDRKNLWSDRSTERYDTKTREAWIDLEGHPPLVVGLRVDVHFELPPAAPPVH